MTNSYVVSLLCVVVIVVCGVVTATDIPIDPDANRSFCEIVAAKGYPCEMHNVTTQDGYILTVFRIPHNRKSTVVGPPVHLQHGLLDSSITWIINYPNQSLPYVLSDAGYDVWMGNNRGTRYGKNHTHLDVKKKEFWAFSWDQMAEYDIPAFFHYVLNNGNPKYTTLTYVGHSEGTTQMFAALVDNPPLRKLMNGFVGLGPVIYVDNIQQEFFKWAARLNLIEFIALFGNKQFLPTPDKLHSTFVEACATCPTCCDNVIEFICGPHRGAFNDSRMPVVGGQEPGGTSVQNMHHWSQMVNHHTWQKYDYGFFGNRKHYHKDHPPKYNIAKYPQDLPTALYSGSHDLLADPQDVSTLEGQLPINTTCTRVVQDYAHLDFCWALSANELIYQPMLKYLPLWVNGQIGRVEC